MDEHANEGGDAADQDTEALDTLVDCQQVDSTSDNGKPEHEGACQPNTRQPYVISDDTLLKILAVSSLIDDHLHKSMDRSGSDTFNALQLRGRRQRALV